MLAWHGVRLRNPFRTLCAWHFRNELRRRTSCRRLSTLHLHFARCILHCLSHANPAPKAVHFQFSILNCQTAFRMRTPRQRLFTFNFQFSIVKPPFTCEPRAKGCSLSIFNFQFSIVKPPFTCELRAKGCSTFNSQFSIFNFQLSNRLSHANSAPRAAPLSIFNSQFSTFKTPSNASD
jgi:hypothetical protein